MTTTLPLDAIEPNPNQPRKHFDEAALRELADSIASAGLLQPIVVRPVDDRYVIIAGERRWRAARLAALEDVPVVIRDVDEATAFELAMIENVVRADMNPVEEAVGYGQLVDAGLTVETIAERTGKAAGSIANRLKLLRLAAPLRDLVAVGQLDAYDAVHVARLNVENQYRVVRAMNAGEIRYVGDLVRLTTALYTAETQTTAFGDDEAPVNTVEHQRAQRDLVDELTRAITALEHAEQLLAAGTVPANPAHLAALGERAKRLAAKVASESHKTRAVETARLVLQ